MTLVMSFKKKFVLQQTEMMYTTVNQNIQERGERFDRASSCRYGFFDSARCHSYLSLPDTNETEKQND